MKTQTRKYMLGEIVPIFVAFFTYYFKDGILILSQELWHKVKGCLLVKME